MSTEKVNILIVDDDKTIRHLYSNILHFKGYNICGTAKNGVEAIHLTNEMNPKPDIILMDYRMPLKNGLDAAREILKTYPKIKIILISCEIKIRGKISKNEEITFIKKPMRVKDLIGIISEYVNKQENKSTI